MVVCRPHSLASAEVSSAIRRVFAIATFILATQAQLCSSARSKSGRSSFQVLEGYLGVPGLELKALGKETALTPSRNSPIVPPVLVSNDFVRADFHIVASCPRPRDGWRGYVVSGLFFCVLATTLFVHEIWWRCLANSDAKGSLELWSDSRLSLGASVLFTGLAVAEIVLRLCQMGPHQLLFEDLENTMTFGILSIVAWADVLVQRAHCSPWALCVFLAVAMLVQVGWFEVFKEEQVTVGRMHMFLRCTGCLAALVLCAQAVSPQSTLRCAACYALALHGVVCVYIGSWLCSSWRSGCPGTDDVQLAVVNGHARAGTFWVSASFLGGSVVICQWAIRFRHDGFSKHRELTNTAEMRCYE